MKQMCNMMMLTYQRIEHAHLNGCRDKEELLFESQLLAVLSGVVGVQHRADVLSLALLINGLQNKETQRC